MGSQSHTRSFEQERKAAAATVSGQIETVIAEWYDTPTDRITAVEHEIDGEYPGGSPGTIRLLEYAGVDYIVQPELGVARPVALRVRPGEDEWRDMTLRTRNGTTAPSEWDSIPAAISEGGLYPREYVLGIRDHSDTLHRALLLDTAEMFRAIDEGEIQVSEERHNNDGSAYRSIPVADLLREHVHRDSWFRESRPE
jgi:hypothetical protein